MFSERSGVVNIGLEGMMLMGAFFGIWGADTTGSWVLGLAHRDGRGRPAWRSSTRFFAIHLRADQIVGGTAVNFLAVGITGYLFIQIYHGAGRPRSASPIDPERPHPVPRGHGIPRPGVRPSQPDDLAQLRADRLLYVFVFKTPLGLRIRAVGEHPRAADTVGIDVYAHPLRRGDRSPGVLAAIGGAYLSIGFGGTPSTRT